MVRQVVDFQDKNNDALIKEPEKDRLKWTNSDNDLFYAHVKAEGLIELSIKAGLNTACDLQKISPIISEAKSILEVGAGYGRVIQYLLKNHFSADITAIERNTNLFEHLKLKYSDKIALFNLDVFHCDQIPKRFDLILYLWLGLADFPGEDQPKVVTKLKNLLNPDGKLVIDTMPDDTLLLLSKQLDEKTFLLTVDDSKVYIRKPHEKDIKEYARIAGFSKVEKHPYTTTTGRDRILYVLS